MSRRRRKRRKDRFGPEAGGLQGESLPVSVNDEVPSVEGGGANGRAANREVPEADGAHEEAKGATGPGLDAEGAVHEASGPEVGEPLARAEGTGRSEIAEPAAVNRETADGDGSAARVQDSEAVIGKAQEPPGPEPQAIFRESGATGTREDEEDIQVLDQRPVGPEPAERQASGLKAAVKKASGRGGRDRRQHARFVVGGRAKGRVTAIYDARILDISTGGSLVEHTSVVRPGTLSSLDIVVLGKRMSLKCRVARSVVHRTEIQPDGDQELVYHTGLEFLDRSDETRRLIIDYIQSILGDGKRP